MPSEIRWLGQVRRSLRGDRRRGGEVELRYPEAFALLRATIAGRPPLQRLYLAVRFWRVLNDAPRDV